MNKRDLAIKRNDTARLKCSNCGKELRRSKSRVKDYPTQYCDRECQAEHYKERFTGKNNPNFKDAGRMYCAECGKEFHSYNKTRKYCSLRCHYGKTKEVLDCRYCREEFIAPKGKKRMFCTQSCYFKWVDDNSIKIEKTCPECNKRFTVQGATKMKTYCSTRCWGIRRKQLLSGSGNPRWTGGTVRYRGEDWKEARERALERDGWACRRCGEQEKRISVHHIVPWRVRQDNSLKNLISLCDTCHPREENHYRQFGKPSRKILELMGCETIR